MDSAGRGSTGGGDAVIVEGVRAATYQALVRALDAAGAPAPRAFADLSLGAWRSHQAAGELLAQVAGHPPPLADRRARRAPAERLAHGELISAGVDAEAQGSRPVLATLRLVQALLAALGGRAASFVVLAPRFGLPWDLEEELFIRLLASRIRTPARLMIVSAGPGDPPEIHGVRIRWYGEAVPAPTLPPAGAGAGAGASLLALIPGVVEPGLRACMEGQRRRDHGSRQRRRDHSSLAPPEADGDIAAPPEAHVPGSPGEHDAGDQTPVAQLTNGYWLVAPECRRAPMEVSRLVYDKLHAAASALGVAWLTAYAQYRGNTIYVDPHNMAAQAWERFEEDGSGVALRLMARAAECATFPDAQWLEVQIQGMRLALARYREVAAAGDPSPAYEQQVRGFLMGAKGWGVVMGDNPGSAGRYLDEARRLISPDDRLREYLYLLNISALVSFKTGDLDTAMAMETEIEARRAALRPPDWSLAYVNSINLARIHLRREDLDGGRRYYEQALATTLGVRSESDCIYTNLCLARLDARAGRRREAFHGWLRAALHRAASRAPEALAPRAVAAILRRWPSPAEDVTEDVARALATQLAASARQVGIEVAPGTHTSACPHPPRFIHVEALPRSDGRLQAAMACGSQGWGLVAFPGPPGPPGPPDAGRGGPADRWLRALLHELLMVLAPVDEVREAGCFTVDDRLGREVPADAPDLVASCVRVGVPRLWFDGVDMELDEALCRQLEAASVVSVGSAVDRFEDRDGRIVIFKRYRLPYRLSEPESRLLVRCAQGTATLAALASEAGVGGWRDTVVLVRALEEARVLTVDLGDSACSAAGSRLPSSASLSVT